MAAIAASWMFAGVSKSGSPALRLTTSRPAAFISSARLVMASVAEGLMRDRRSARKGMAALPGMRRQEARYTSSAGSGMQPRYAKIWQRKLPLGEKITKSGGETAGRGKKKTDPH